MAVPAVAGLVVWGEQGLGLGLVANFWQGRAGLVRDVTAISEEVWAVGFWKALEYQDWAGWEWCYGCCCCCCCHDCWGLEQVGPLAFCIGCICKGEFGKGARGEEARPDTGPGGGMTRLPSMYRSQRRTGACRRCCLAATYSPHRACLWACSSRVKTSLMLI